MNDYQTAKEIGQATRLWAKLRALRTFHGSHNKFALFTDENGKPDIELITDDNETRFVSASNFIGMLGKKTTLCDIEELI